MRLQKRTLTAVVLSKTVSKDVFDMTQECINSLLCHAGNANESLEISIIVVESAPPDFKFASEYANCTLLRPESEFHFHRYLNLGLKYRPADLYMLCNNDLYFHENWCLPLLEAIDRRGCGSVSPACPELQKYSSAKAYSSKKPYVEGYGVRKEISGWCIMLTDRTLKQIGYLDERFEFYFADNDYAMELRRNGVRHCLSRLSKVTHLEHVKQTLKIPPPLYDCEHAAHNFLSTSRPPDWVRLNPTFLNGFNKFCGKWGNYYIVKVKSFVFDFIICKIRLRRSGIFLFPHSSVGNPPEIPKG
jgi:hypothetical protein